MTLWWRRLQTVPQLMRVILVSLVVALLVGAAVGAGIVIGRAQSQGHAASPSGGPSVSTTTNGTGMMGQGMGATGGQTTLTNTAAALQQQARALAPEIQVDTATNTIRYTSPQVHLVMVGAPPGRSGMYWQVDGRSNPINPTVVIPAGATISLVFANGDADTMHGWELTASAPPYASMPMMSVATTPADALIMPVASTQGGATWHGAALTFATPLVGVYYYLCPVPGHAQQGMWGKLTVR